MYFSEIERDECKDYTISKQFTASQIIWQVHPNSTYEINLNSVWSGIGLMENNLLNANQVRGLRLLSLSHPWWIS